MVYNYAELMLECFNHGMTREESVIGISNIVGLIIFWKIWGVLEE